jgi:glycosyltransferase involved in cell wall biosynthesis
MNPPGLQADPAEDTEGLIDTYSRKNLMVLYSVIIPAYNEEAYLPKTLKVLREAMDALALPGEVIVVDNNSTDRTAEVARTLGARVIQEPVNQISRARNAGAKAARGRFFVFVDADTLLPSDLLKAAVDNLSGGTCCGGGAVISLDDYSRPFARQGIAAWTWISLKFGFAAGSFMYCLREGFEAIGGLDTSVYAGDEIPFSRRLRTWGKTRGMTFELIKDPPVITSSRKLDWYSPSQLIGLVILMIVLPFAPHFRSLCAFWYKRPANPKGGGR